MHVAVGTGVLLGVITESFMRYGPLARPGTVCGIVVLELGLGSIRNESPRGESPG